MSDPVPQFRRRASHISARSLVRRTRLSERSLPLVVRPEVRGLPLLPWATGESAALDADLAAHGAVLFRGFVPPTLDELEALVATLAGDLLEYTHRSTPRRRVSGRIFTSTEYPSDQTIPQHNELSFARGWPERLFLCCVEAPGQGGETPIADSRRVYARIDPAVRERFERDGVQYVRNYGGGLDLSWPEVFQTESRSEVEAYCAAAGITVEWKPGGGLRTIQVSQAVVDHPTTGERVWFNQAHLFHVSNLDPEVREALLSTFAPEDLPRNAYHGDGTSIPPASLDAIRAAYAAEEVVFPWEEGDVLMIDNLLVSHGRRPFSGPRRIVVAMTSRGGAA